VIPVSVFSSAFRRRFAAYAANRHPHPEGSTPMRQTGSLLTTHDCVLMPPAPLQARIPKPAGDDDIATRSVLEDIARLHLAAFVSLHGLPPEAVAYQLVSTGKVGSLRPAFAFTLQGPDSPKTRAWLSAVQDGLDSWAQAGWANPIVTERCGADVLWWTADLAEAACEAAARLKILGRVEALANLAAYLPGGLPAHLDPGNPSFGWHGLRKRV
jgi:hypothetical protein